tara:strand:- start:194 stop:823 length:630 start_codon:yes stop_codon:yes gene_type:complete
MKIKLPENQSEITLGQYQKYLKLIERLESNELEIYTFNRRKIVLFTNLLFKDTANITQVDFESIINQIDLALNEQASFKSRFKLNGIEFGFIPNVNDITSEEMMHLDALDSITQGEFIDGSNNTNNVEDLHKLMAVLFRPITNKDSFGNYEIASYSGTKKYSELMKEIPLSVANGALFFFVNLATELQEAIQKYTKEVQKKEVDQATTL